MAPRRTALPPSTSRRARRLLATLSTLALAPAMPNASGALTALAAQSVATTAAPGMNGSAGTWVRESWTVREGLPVNAINELLQDRTGYVWAATFDGLVRFDGVRFTVFRVANSPGLPSNRIVRLRETRDGSLWLFTEQEQVVRLRDGVFTDFTRTLSRRNELITAAFDEDSAGTIWLGSRDGLWMLRGDSLQRLGHALGALPVTTLIARRDGSMWVGTEGKGLYRVGDGGRTVQRVGVEPALDTATFTTMHEDTGGRLWVATMQGMWVGRERFERVTLPRIVFAPFGWLTSPRDGAMFAMARTGLYRIDGTQGEFVEEVRMLSPGHRLWSDGGSVWHASGSRILRDGQPVFSLDADSLPPNVNPATITTVLLDREGSIWLGTRSAGLHRLKPGIAETFGVPEGAGRNAQTVHVARDGTVFVGVWDEGLRQIDPSTRRARRVPIALPQFNLIYSLAETARGELLVGTARGLFTCDRTTERCRTEGPDTLLGARVTALHRDRRGTIWAGLSSPLLFRLDSAGWTRLDNVIPRDARYVYAIADTRDGALWLGTDGSGLVRYANGRATVLTTRDGLPSDVIRSLREDEDGWLWIGTAGNGLARIDPAGWSDGGRAERRRIVTLTSEQGVFDDVIHAMLEDNFGRLWMSGNRGISWISRNELAAFAEGRIGSVRAVSYNERDGMRNREANGGKQPSGAKGADGRLWFPTQDGVVVFDPRRVRPDSLSPPVVVERVVTGHGTPRRRARDDAMEVVLGVDQRDFQVEYTAMTFLEPGNVRFRYRLEGYDTDWVDADRRRIAFYTKVPPGRYTFRVQASTGGGAWREPGATMVVYVEPRLWETVIFRFAAALALMALALGAVRRRVRQAGERARELQRLVDERTAALRGREHELAQQNVQLAGLAEELRSLDRAKTRFFANVSHELRTPLTLTIGPLEDVRVRASGDPQMTRWLDLALRNARRLLRLVNQILDVAKLEAGEMKLSPRPIDLAAFTRGLVAAFAPAAERAGIALSLDAPESSGALLDPDAVEKILTNLLSNALKFTPSGGEVTVTLSAGDGEVVFAVRDTGPGIPADQLAHVFERFYQVDESAGRTQPGTGIGLALVKELVDLQRGTVDVVSGASGTVFTVRLPSGAVPAGVVAEEARPSLVTTSETALEPVGAPTLQDGDGADDDARPERPTLLIVDDSDDLRQYIGDHFAARFRIVHAGDGAAGIAAAREHLPDVIVSDVMMPGTDGLALVRALRASAETDFLPVILLTAQAEDEQRIAGLERGADDYLVKPFDMRELDARVTNIIAARQRLRARHLATLVNAGAVTGAPAPSPARSPADQLFADKLLAAVRRHLADPDFGVGELADAVATDRSHLFRRVKQVLGESPSALLRRMRLEEAGRLLAEGDAPVADVAYAVGFNSVSHFSHAFAAQFGATPVAYRGRRTRRD